MLLNHISQAKDSACRVARTALSVVLAVSLCPTVPAAYADEASGSFAVDTSSEQESGAVDITARWNAGGMGISAGGTYVLSDDVHTDGTLVIAAPEGETVTLDLRGHSAEVRGNVQAAVSLDDSAGMVRIIDSAFDDAVARGERDADAAPASQLRLVATEADAAVAAVRWNASEESKDAQPALELSHVAVQAALLSARAQDESEDATKLDCYGVYAGYGYETDADALDVALAGCSVEAVVAGEKDAAGQQHEWIDAAGQRVDAARTGSAVAVLAKVKGVKLDGKTQLSAESEGGAAQLYSTRDAAFALGEGFAVDGTVKAFAAGNAEGAVLATCASDEQAQRLASTFVDATGKHACEVSGANIVCAKQSAAATGSSLTASAEQAAESSSDEQSAGAKRIDAPVSPQEHAANPFLTVQVEGCPLELPEWVTYLAEQSIDLNKAWANKASSFQITESGTYFLSDDLELTNEASLFVSGKNTRVTLNLNGHTLHFDCASNGGHAISVSGTASLAVEGGNGGAIIDTGLNTFDVLYQNSTGELTVNNAQITVRPSQRYSNPKALNMRAVAVQRGSATIDNSTLTVDQTNVATASVETAAVNPAGVYVGNDSSATALSVSNTSITVVASPATVMGNASDLDDADYTGPGFSAYGVYAGRAATATTVSNCTVNVTSVYGQAIGVAARKATIADGKGSGNGLAVTASSQYVAAAVQSLSEGGVTLNADVSYAVGEGSAPRRSTTLFAAADKAFVLGAGFTGKGVSLLERVSGQENAADMVAATFGYAPTTAQLSALTSQLSNALGDDAACDIEAAAEGVAFRLIDENAPVEVVHANGAATAYANVDQAFAAARDGETLRLRSDVGAVNLTGGQADATITIDLAGHAAGALNDAAQANVVVTSTGDRGAIEGISLVRSGSSTRTEAAVVYAGAGSLTLRDIDVKAVAERYELAGVQVAESAAGALSLENVNVHAESSIAAVSALSVASAANAVAVNLSAGSLSTLQMASSASAYGVRCQSTSVPVALSDCPVSVLAQAGSAYAAYTAGPLSAASDKATGQSLSVSMEAVSSQGVVGVYAFGKKADVRLRNCQVAVRCDQPADSASYWALSASDATGSITLDGTCTFESASGKTLREKGNVLTLAEGFESAGADSITVDSDGLTGDEFATAQASGEAADALAALFEPLAGTVYEGWSAVAREGGKLAWSSEPVVRNLTSGAGYASAAKAFDEAADGDTLQVVADGASHAALTSAKNLTLDLAGRAFTVYADAAGAVSAISVSAGTLAIVDSSEDKGQLTLRLGAASERVAHSASAGSPYAGVSVGAGAGLDVSAAQLQVCYVGGGPTEQIKTQDVVGAYTAAGSVSLLDGAKLVVSGANDSACAGSAYGVYVGVAAAGASAPAVNVSASSQVDVSNNGGLIDLGFVRDGTQGSDFEEGYQALVRIQPDESTALYQEILQKFRAHASLDEGEDASGENNYGMRCYYVERLSLDDGTLIWAASKPVPAGQETLDNIVPEVVFVQTLYQAAPKAYGVGGADAATGTVSVSGRVNAEAANGDAYGVAACGSGSWTVDGAAVSAQGGTETYRGAQDKKINLSDYFEVQNPPSKNWFYPSFADPHLVCDQAPIARAVAATDEAALTLGGNVTLSAQAADASEIQAAKFTAGAVSASQADEPLRVSSPAGANVSGATFAVPEQGATLSAAQFVDAYGVLSPEAAADGSLAWGGPYTVTFHGETNVVVTYDNLVNGATVALPDPQQMEKTSDATKQYVFVGWARSADATEADVAADAQSVVVNGNADYYPVYRVAAKSVAVTFGNLRAADGSVLPNQQASVDYNGTIAQSPLAQAPVQGDYQTASGTWKFVGWQDSLGRVWDGAGLSTDVTFNYTTFAGASSGAVTLSAAYVLVATGQHVVTFKVDGRAYAYAADNGEAPSFYRATGSTAVAPTKVATTAGYLYTFEGWHAGRLLGTAVGKDRVDFAATAALPAADGDVVYTACFSAAQRQAYARFKYWKPAGNSYSYGFSSQVSVPYGSDPISEANKLVKPGDVVVVNGTSYEFLGWSVREDDKEPLYIDSLPGCTNTDSMSDRSGVYYGIYKLDEQKVTVTFYDGGAVYASAADQTASSTVDEALTAAGATKPATRADGKVFKGWATAADATAANVNGSATLQSVAGSANALSLYAVYGDAYSPTLTFVSADGSVLGSVQVASGATLAQVKGIPSVPALAGRFFRGWAYGTGTLVGANEGFAADARLVASYGDISTNAIEGDDETNVTGFVDVSQATLTSSEAQGASQVTFYLNNSTSVNSTLTSQAKVNGDAIVSDAVYAVKYLVDNTGLAVSDNVGRVTLNLKCGAAGAGAKVRVYWTRGDGTVGYTDALTSDGSGMISFTLSSYSALSADGNVAIAEVGAAAGSLDGSTVSGGGLNGATGTTGAALSGSTLSGTLELASATGAALDGATADGAALEGADGAALAGDSAQMGEGSDAGNGEGIDLLSDRVDTSVAISDIAGNPVMWVLAILVLALIAALAWYFLVGRKRGTVADEDDDEAGWSDDADGKGDAAGPAAAAAAAQPAASANDAKTGGISF